MAEEIERLLSRPLNIEAIEGVEMATPPLEWSRVAGLTDGVVVVLLRLWMRGPPGLDGRFLPNGTGGWADPEAEREG